MSSRNFRCTRKQVILSEEQAELMLTDEDFLLLPGVPSTPVPSGADVSLGMNSFTALPS